MTNEEYVDKLKTSNPNVINIDKYINMKTPIKHKCLVHNEVWDVTPSSVLQGCGCNKCKSEKISIKNIVPKEVYSKKLQKKLPHINIVGDYINSGTPIEHYCTIHNISWRIKPSDMLYRCGCIECSKEQNFKNIRKTREQYIEELADKNPRIELIGDYVNNTTKTLHRCKKHDFYWDVRPGNVLLGHDCPICQKEAVISSKVKNHSQYIEDVYKKNPNIEVIGKYVNAHTSILHKCKKCGYEWLCTPNNILSGNRGCQKCQTTIGEECICKILDKFNILYKYQRSFQNCKDINMLPFDFYLPDYNMVIEYQGEQHYKPIDFFGGEEKFKIQQKHDKIKKDYCEKNNISFLEIPYWEFDNIEDILIDCLKLYENN